MNRLAPTPITWRLLRLGGDLAAAVGAFYLAFLARIHLNLPLTQFPLPANRLRFFESEWWVIAASQALILYFFGFYDPPGESRGPERTRRLLTAMTVQGLGLAGYYFLTDLQFPRSVLLLFVLVNGLLLATWRGVMARLYRAPQRRVALVGGGPAARELASKISGHAMRDIEVVGWVPAPDEAEILQGDAVLGPCLGTVSDLPGLLASGGIDDIIVATAPRSWQTTLLDQLATLHPARGSVLLLPGPMESLIGRMRYRWVDDMPLIEVVRQSEWQTRRPIKRLIDLMGGMLLLVLALPLLLLCALVILLTSGSPVFYRQARLGLARSPFTLWKLRTMRLDAESETGEILAVPGDPRLTAVGAWLRRLRLDELPQLVHVIAGSMSLVGPRPERPGFVEKFLAEIPGYAERFTVPPGLTGLAQIHGDYHSTPENKLRYDLAYIANWSPWLDLAILFRTVKIVLTSRGL